MIVRDTRRVSEKWCVITEDNRRYVLDDDSNAGFGPVNVWSNGLLVRVRFRHRHGALSTACDV